MISKGFVAISSEPITDEIIRCYIQSWLTRFHRVEQVSPTDTHANVTLHLKSCDEYIPHDQVQFRVLHGDDFAWVYITRNRRVIETTGLPLEEFSLCLEVLLELPSIQEIINDQDDRRLNELESQGLL
ncbi:MAG: hypothetical protein NZM04_10535 [Methylacidiphilales bacterium]|nr:hypothetical protein [Candidatus Methylacidiphilales bacterium]MDW8349059.1 hypothetical protein [Verrucomicrobiae bacterium]